MGCEWVPTSTSGSSSWIRKKNAAKELRCARWGSNPFSYLVAASNVALVTRTARPADQSPAWVADLAESFQTRCVRCSSGLKLCAG